MANGNRPASAKYNIPESTIRGFVKSYKEGKLADDNANELQAIPRKKRGGYKLLPEEVDEKVIKLVKEMQSSGAAMPYNILIGIAKGVVTANDRTVYL